MESSPYRDVRALCQRFGIQMPPEYDEFERKAVAISKTKREVTMFRFPSGQSIEVFGPSNRTRKAKYQHFNGPVIGLEVDDIIAASIGLLTAMLY
jgi:hypothetical protein